MNGLEKAINEIITSQTFFRSNLKSILSEANDTFKKIKQKGES